MSSHTLHFCTLFDKNYSSRGIAMYESLYTCEKDFMLYIFAFDDSSYQTLQQMQLDKVRVISLQEFEDDALLAIKGSRSKGEYCWTCTSSTIAYCISTFQLANCTYVDADLFFYQSPRVLIDEIPADKHVMITEHRYTRYYDQSKVSGKYCVQFMYFDNSKESLEVLHHWRAQCLDWCYNRIEDGKFGDQKYLDTWTSNSLVVYEMQHLGGGLAPWNIQQYTFTTNANKLIGKEKSSNKSFEVIFYHFHGLKFYEEGQLIYTPNTYYINSAIRTLFYNPYVQALAKAKARLNVINNSIDWHGSAASSNYFKDKYIKGKVAFIISNVFKNILHI